MIGRTISHYKIVDKLGEGGMGAVYKAEDTTLNRLVALKVLSSHLAENDEARERFVREAQAASAINHPNITTVFELLEEDDTHYISMEYVDGKTIRDMVESGHVSIRKAVDIILQAAEALSAAHRKGILHRDVKSANIMVSMEGNVKVMDFGLAHLEERSQLTRTGSTMGTLAYSSPEQLTGNPYDERSEIWSLGVVFYELLTGELPFKSPSEGELLFAIINNEQAPPSTLRDNLPVPIDGLIMRMLEKAPEARYEDCGDLIKDLNQIRIVLETSTIGQSIASPRKLRIGGLSAYVTATIVVILAVIVILNPFSTSVQLNPHKVVIYDPVDQSNDQSLGALGPQLSSMLYSRIRQTGFLEPADFSHTSPASRILKDRILAGESLEPVMTLAKECRAGIGISGDFFLDNDNLECHLRIVNCRSNQVFPLEVVAGPLSQRTQVLEECATLILVELAQRFNPAYLMEWSRITSTPPNLEALEIFNEGLDAWRSSKPDVALERFLQAASFDTSYHASRLWAARQLTVYGRTGEADSLLQLLDPHRDSLSRIEQLMFDHITAKVSRDWEEAYRITQMAHQLEPGSIWTWEAGQAAKLIGRLSEAMELFDQLDPNDPAVGDAVYYWGQMGDILWIWEDFRGLLKLVRKAKRYSTHTPLALLDEEMAAYAGLGRIDDLLPLVERQMHERPAQWFQLDFIISTLRHQGFEDEALLVAERMLQFHEQRPVEDKNSDGYRSRLANIYYRLHRYDEARQIWSQLHSDHPIPETNSQLWYGVYLGTIAARENNRERAEVTIDWLKELEAPELYPFSTPYALACVHSLLGENEQAVHYLRESYYAGRILYQTTWDTDLIPLRSYKPYRELMGFDQK